MLGYVVSKRLLTHCLHCILGLVVFNVKKAEPDQKVLQCELSPFCLKTRGKKINKKSEHDAWLVTDSGVHAKQQ